jgi:hypothetical protein
MTCDQCADRLSELLAGELEPYEEREMRSHFAGCSACALALEQMREVVSLLHQLPEVEPPEQLRGRLSEIPTSAKPRFPAVAWRVGSVVTGIAAAAAILLVWMGVSHSPTHSPEQVALEMPADPESAFDTAAPSPEIVLDEFPAANGAAEPDAEAAAEVAAEVPPASHDREPRRRVTEPQLALAPSPSPARESRRPPARAEAPRPAAPSQASRQTPQEQRQEPPAAFEVAQAPEEEPPAALSRGTLPMPRAAYLDAPSGLAQRFGEGTPFTVAVRPPAQRVTGVVVPATIVVETERDVARAQVSVTASDLELIGLGPEGLLFDGPLKAGQETVLSVPMISRTAGERSITMRVQSTDPIVDTQLKVDIGAFKQALPASERPVQFDFEGTPIREAVGRIARASGMLISIDDAVGNPTVTLRMEDQVPALAALQLVVDAAGCRLVEKNGAFTIEAGGTR